MTYWEDYSPDFEDAYDRFEYQVDDEPIFNEWVNKFDNWINKGREARGLEPIEPSYKQIRALAYYAEEKGIENISVEAEVPDRRYKSGFRMGFRDVDTNKVVSDPYKKYEKETGEKAGRVKK